MKGLCAVMLYLTLGLATLGPPGATPPSAPTDDAPQPPTLSALQALLGPDYVTVTCAEANHPSGQYGIIGPACYALSAMSRDAAGYTVTLTLFEGAYLEAFGIDTRRHHLSSQGRGDADVPLFYDAAQDRWALRDPGSGVVFVARCQGTECPLEPPLTTIRLGAGEPSEDEEPAIAVLLPSGGAGRNSLILTGIGLLAASAAAAYLGRRRDDLPN